MTWQILEYVNICKMHQHVNKVALVLAQHARTIIDDMYWMKDLPPLDMEALYQDANFID